VGLGACHYKAHHPSIAAKDEIALAFFEEGAPPWCCRERTPRAPAALSSAPAGDSL